MRGGALEATGWPVEVSSWAIANRSEGQ